MSYHAFGDAGMCARRPIPRFDRGLSAHRRRDPRPGLADDPDFFGRGQWSAPALDPDLEAGTWPDWVDQTRFERLGRLACWHDDAEADDEDHGIEDLPQDAREEDGI